MIIVLVRSDFGLRYSGLFFTLGKLQTIDLQKFSTIIRTFIFKRLKSSLSQLYTSKYPVINIRDHIWIILSYRETKLIYLCVKRVFLFHKRKLLAIIFVNCSGRALSRSKAECQCQRIWLFVPIIIGSTTGENGNCSLKYHLIMYAITSQELDGFYTTRVEGFFFNDTNYNLHHLNINDYPNICSYSMDVFLL